MRLEVGWYVADTRMFQQPVESVVLAVGEICGAPGNGHAGKAMACSTMCRAS